jgi:hypothetical protein
VNWTSLRHEWGAVTFVLTVIAGMIVVPIALYFANQGPGAIATPNLSTSPTPIASSARLPTPTPSPSASPSASPSPSK